MLVNVGYGNVVNMNKVISIVRADAAPIKRMIQNAKDAGLAVDATCGRKQNAFWSWTVDILFCRHFCLKRLRAE